MTQIHSRNFRVVAQPGTDTRLITEVASVFRGQGYRNGISGELGDYQFIAGPDANSPWEFFSPGQLRKYRESGITILEV